MINFNKNFPAEWQEHRVTWLAWPIDKITFPDRLKNIEKIYCQIIAALTLNEQVNLIVKNDAEKIRVGNILKENLIAINQINFFIADYADVWTRDYIPTFVMADKKMAAVKWQYNAYGQKFPDLLKDNEVFYQINVGNDILEPKINLEGGAIETNGNGLLITTEQCLLNKNRNPDLTKKNYEDVFAKFLGIKKTIWLKDGITNDHTDGHIDDVAKFVNANTVLLAEETDINNPNFEILKTNFELLKNALDKSEPKLNIVKLPLPHFYYDDGSLAPASYANFYIANSVVLVPQYNDANDAIAMKIIKPFFPNRKVIGIDCTDLIYGGGALHCITQQVPV